MKNFITPEMDTILFCSCDVLTASGDAPASSTAAPTTTAAPVTTVPDKGLDNEVSADKWPK